MPVRNEGNSQLNLSVRFIRYAIYFCRDENYLINSSFSQQIFYFFEENLNSRYPYNSYKQVFVDEASADFQTFASLSIFKYESLAYYIHFTVANPQSYRKNFPVFCLYHMILLFFANSTIINQLFIANMCMCICMCMCLCMCLYIKNADLTTRLFTELMFFNVFQNKIVFS